MVDAIPLERALNGLPGIVTIASTSTWQRSRVELIYAGRPSPAAVEQVTAIVLAEWAGFDVSTSRPVITVGPAMLF